MSPGTGDACLTHEVPLISSSPSNHTMPRSESPFLRASQTTEMTHHTVAPG